MCGIIGILGKEPVVDGLVDALKRLEYRGYDSAGVATLEDGVLARRRAQGKLRNLEAVLAEHPLRGTAGIGHTRWATHGVPSERNAHPHMTARVSLVHNGIIENFQELRAELEAESVVFDTETDTEAVVHLISRELARGATPEDAQVLVGGAAGRIASWSLDDTAEHSVGKVFAAGGRLIQQVRVPGASRMLAYDGRRAVVSGRKATRMPPASGPSISLAPPIMTISAR